ncbi:peptide-N4-asparagine amidase [Lysobacter arvi]|uniref:Peptide N-acetyl-beta-D-glucosaminyl asparaginase amidase A N-terminal domain-containing protein n=1 Tax=Lysobacter arvi TaxID=3038776 RepID=A0ABU1CG05_9GAMM|nr:peptide-N4-asparagine amidase [Lysobacter arvi]MDR0183881.1 hypothetical protein [Lysobacter arvi]
MKNASRIASSAVVVGLLATIVISVHAAQSRHAQGTAGRAVSGDRVWAFASSDRAAIAPAASPASASAANAGDVVTVVPDVPRPPGTPCEVQLLQDVEMDSIGIAWFDGEGVFPYAPPAACPGPWAKVVLKMSLRSDSTNSYLDGFMYASLWLDGIPLYSGGAQDHRGPTQWNIERDLTDYTAHLMAPRDGTLRIDGTPRYGPNFSSPYYVSATMQFYPATATHPAPRVPDEVHDLSNPPLPRNIERAYLDVMTHPNLGNDLFWFTCVPDSAMAAFPELANRLAIGPNRFGLEGDPPPQGCKGGAFREAQITIDGQPAGVAPVFPRVYPYFNVYWHTTRMTEPAPPPQALNLVPYRVDLTPFAALLSDGAPHRIGIQIAGLGELYGLSSLGALLIYRDPDTAQVTGQVTRNTLAGRPPAPTVTSTLSRNAAGEVSGEVRTTSVRSYAIEGYIDTSRGRIRSTVERNVRLENVLLPYSLDPPGVEGDAYRLGVDHETSVTGVSRRYLGGQLVAEDREVTRYPLMLDYALGSVDLQQRFVQQTERWRPNTGRHLTRLNHEVGLTLAIDQDGQPTRWSGQHDYSFRDSQGSCYRAGLSTQGGTVIGTVAGVNCTGGANRLFWASHPDGSPDSLGWAER